MNPTVRGTVRALSVCMFLAAAAQAATAPVRERIPIDSGWKFRLGDDLGDGARLDKAGASFGPAGIFFSDAGWRSVDLPHDWVVELPFDPRADASHGFKPVGEGFRGTSIGWYRRALDLPASDANKRIWLEFDGVYRDCLVYVNGWLVTHHESGYSGFRCDITDLVERGGKNVVAVRVDASLFEGWFYEGAGIYRHVWLVKTSPVAVAPDGVLVRSTFAAGPAAGPASVQLEATLANASLADTQAAVTWTVFAPDGTVVGTASASGGVSAGSHARFAGSVPVPAPLLWAPETPYLYRVETDVSAAGLPVDRVETPFGLRTVGFDANRGFLLNGKPYLLKGTSNHQDHAGLGSALPDALQYFRVARLKEMGCNAYRTAHNPPTPELLEACDRLGMLVMDENRLVGSDDTRLGLLRELVMRDRNHPSVAIWSLGNEEFAIETREVGGRVAATMQAVVKSLDPTRPVTINADVANVYTGVNSAVEVRGWSYRVGPGMDDYHREHPLQPNVGSEQGSTVGTRGIYKDDKARGYVSAYDDWAPSWAQTAETWMTFFSSRPWLSGGFVWTGFDYRGEPTPYAWPCISSHFGVMDTCGFPKDNYYYYQAWWLHRPVLHIVPHWNWPGMEGMEVDVRLISNCEEVELSLNGRSLGRKPVLPYSQVKWRVPYQAGTLSARGYNAGKAVIDATVETAGTPAALSLSPDRTEILADGRDAAVFTVSVLDAAGRRVPLAGNPVSFSVKGPGHIIGVGNGDPSSHEPDKFLTSAPVRSRPLNTWRFKRFSNTWVPDQMQAATTIDDTTWGALDAFAETGPLHMGDRALFHGRFDVEKEDLESEGVELRFNHLVGGALIVVNGQAVGRMSDARTPSVYDVKAVLHIGANDVAVVAGDYEPEPVGITRGVFLDLTGRAPEPVWKRSAFNGLAEVIVQSSGAPGEIRLSAQSDGIAQADAAVEARAPRP